MTEDRARDAERAAGDAASRRARRSTGSLLRHPWRVALAVLLATGALAAGIPRLSTDVGYRAFLGEGHAAVRRFDAFLERYGGGLPLRAVWRCAGSAPCESVFDAASLEMAAAVAAELRDSPAVTRVVHPGNAPIVVPGLFEVEIRRLLERGERAPDAEALARRALGDPSWTGELVSQDGRVGSLIVQLRSSASDVASRAYADLDAALAPFEAEGFVFHRIGGPVEFVVAGAELDAAMVRIVPIMVALVAAGLLLLLRSPAAAACALATVGIAVVWTLGLMGWLGWPRNSLTQTLPPLVLVIGVCDAIHLISRYGARASADRPRDLPARRAALAGALEDVVRPCAMTTVTTAAGFLSFVLADLSSFVRFGVIAAFGVCAAFVLTFTLLPALLLALPAERVAPPRATASWSVRLAWLLGFATRRRRAVLGLALLLGVLGGAGFAALRVDSSFEELYGEDSAVVRWSRFVSEHLAPPDRLEIDVGLPPGETLGSEAVGRVLRDLERGIAASGPLGSPRSFRSRPLWREELLAAGGGDADGLAPWVDLEARHVRISYPAGKLPQGELRAVMAGVRDALADLPDGYTGVATGPFAVVSDMIEAIRATQLTSFATAGGVVWMLLLLYFRSASFAALAILPTALPVVVTLGAMGLLRIPLDVGSAMVAAVVLGVAVDDAIHLLDRFRVYRARGLGAEPAIGRAVREVGQALVSTSLALALGFSALALSPWHSVASFGLVSGVAILAALGSVLVVLPALVCAVDRARA